MHLYTPEQELQLSSFAGEIASRLPRPLWTSSLRTHLKERRLPKDEFFQHVGLHRMPYNILGLGEHALHAAAGGWDITPGVDDEGYRTFVDQAVSDYADINLQNFMLLVALGIKKLPHSLSFEHTSYPIHFLTRRAAQGYTCIVTERTRQHKKVYPVTFLAVRSDRRKNLCFRGSIDLYHSHHLEFRHAMNKFWS